MSKQEKIVCAAVRTNEHGTKIKLYVEYPGHIKQDKQIYGVFGECSHERGFITNKNRFVDAKEAMSIALKACQIQAVENIAMRAAHHKQLGNTSISATERSALEALVESLLARPLKPEDLY